MVKLSVVFLLSLLLSVPQYGFCEGFSQGDRDRLIRLEVKVAEGQASLQRQLDDLKTFLLWGFGILFGGMGILIGFVIWDRRTALEPVIRKSRELEDKEEKLVRVLKEYSNVEPKLADILRSFNLL
jgi:hypothetical protein